MLVIKMFSKIREWLWNKRKLITIFASFYFSFFILINLIGNQIGIDIRLDKINLILAYFFGILWMIFYIMIFALLIMYMNNTIKKHK